MDRAKAVKYYKLAEYQAELFSKDPSTKVATIILSQAPHTILSCGYNGICRGVDDTDPQIWTQPAKDLMIVHSETNCVYNAARIGAKLNNTIAVVTLFPCITCAKALIQSGITVVVTKTPDFSRPKWGEQFRASFDLFNTVGVTLVCLDESEVTAM